MSLPQFLFTLGFAAVFLAIVAFTAVVVRSARFYDGGDFPTGSMLLRLARPGRERAELQRWAFYLHRITGVGVLGFLCLHVIDVSLFVWDPIVYDDVHGLYGTAMMRVIEVGLLFGLLFHTFNGLRLVVVDVRDLGLTASTRLLHGVLAATVVLGVVGSYYIMKPVFA